MTISRREYDELNRKIDLILEAVSGAATAGAETLRSPVDIRLQANRDIEAWRKRKPQRTRKKTAAGAVIHTLPPLGPAGASAQAETGFSGRRTP